MKLIQNTTLQGLNIPLMTPKGIFDLYLRPKSSIVVPESYNGRILENLIKRRMVKVTKVK